MRIRRGTYDPHGQARPYGWVVEKDGRFVTWRYTRWGARWAAWRR